MVDSAHSQAGSTVDPAEIERFARIAEEWWDPRGKFAPLHRLNPVRLGFIRDHAAAHWQRNPLSGAPLQGLSLVDIGCGGGLICEPMARLGAQVTGIDATDRNIATARLHADGQELAIDYRDTLEEGGAAEGDSADSYLTALDAGWVREVEALAGCSTVAPLLRAAADRCAEGQRQTHAAAASGHSELQRWAERLDETADYRWWELAAGASSSVAAHALIAAAAGPALSASTAAAVDAAYNPSIGALTVFLDDLVDLEADRKTGEHNYLAYYPSSAEAAERLAWIAREADARIASLPHASRHRAVLAGVGAFYLSDPAAATPYAQPIRRALLAALGPGTRALTAFMRTRRGFGRKTS